MNILERFRIFSASEKRTLLCATCGLCLPFLSLAQQNKLTVAPPEQVTVKRGAVASEVLSVTVLPGFHVNSDKPRDEFLIPLKLTWTDGPLETKSVAYPQPEEMKLGKDTLVVFTGSIDIRSELKAPQNAPVGPATMHGKLRYQACNTEMCFRPASIDIHVPVVIQ